MHFRNLGQGTVQAVPFLFPLRANQILREPVMYPGLSLYT